MLLDDMISARFERALKTVDELLETGLDGGSDVFLRARVLEARIEIAAAVAEPDELGVDQI